MKDKNEPKVLKHVYGPVPSRRLGRSLGVDIIPAKTCTYDCVYCQLGRSMKKIVERKEYVPISDVLAEVEQKMCGGCEADYVTVSGSGEATLHTQLGELIVGIKKITDTPVAVITNGSLLWDPRVREAISQADLVVPSLDAGDAETFSSVNRPHEDIGFDRMVEGLSALREDFEGEIRLEIFLVKPYNCTRSQVEKIARWMDSIRPDRIELNTVARPPTEPSSIAASREELLAFAELFGDRAAVITYPDSPLEDAGTSLLSEDVLNMLRRRPCSAEDVAVGLSAHPAEATRALEALVMDQQASRQEIEGRIFYVPSDG